MPVRSLIPLRSGGIYPWRTTTKHPYHQANLYSVLARDEASEKRERVRGMAITQYESVTHLDGRGGKACWH
jgi:hypothetical protein